MTTPLINYSSPGKPFWASVNQTNFSSINVSTLTAGTVLAEEIFAIPNSNGVFSVVGQGSNGASAIVATDDSSADVQYILSVPGQKSFAIALPGSQTGAFETYTYQTRSIGTIGFLPGTGPGMGAINLVDEQNDFLFLGQGNLQFNTTSGGSFQSSNIVSSNVTARALSNVSSINGSAYPPQSFPPFVSVTFDSNFTPGNTGYVVPTSNTLIASFPTTVGGVYRVTMNPTFNSTAAPAAGDYLSIYGTGSLGPNDTIDFVTLNLNWAGNGLNPGLAGAYGQAVSGIMTAENSNYEIYGGLSLGTTVSTMVSFGNTNPIVVERLS